MLSRRFAESIVLLEMCVTKNEAMTESFFNLLHVVFTPCHCHEVLLMEECWVSVNERVQSRPALCEKCPEITSVVI